MQFAFLVDNDSPGARTCHWTETTQAVARVPIIAASGCNRLLAALPLEARMNSQRLSIAFVTDAILPYHSGGKEVRTREVTRRIVGRADVHVYTMRWWGPARVRVEDGVTFHALCRQIPLYAGDRRAVRQAVVFALTCLRLATRRFSVIDADQMPILHLFTLRLVATLRRKRLVVTWYEVWGPEYWHRYLGRRGRIAWWIERMAMALPDEIIVLSEETRRRLQMYIGASTLVGVVPAGIDLDAVRRAPVADDPATVVVVGRLLTHKRVDLLLEAVAQLRAQGQAITCRVIGNGPERASLKARAVELGIAHAVDFRADVVDQAGLYSLLKASRVFVFPSEREGFGIAVLEALACGVPVVTTSAPDNLAAQLVVDSRAGIVCDPTAEALADAVLSVLACHDPPVARDDWLRAHDWNTITDTVLAALSTGDPPRSSPSHAASAAPRSHTHEPPETRTVRRWRCLWAGRTARR